MPRHPADKRHRNVRLSRALDELHARMTLADIARESGLPYDALTTFRSAGHIGPARADTLARYLQEKGIPLLADPDGPRRVTITPEDPALQAATLLATLSEMLAAPNLAPADKARLLRAQTPTLDLLASIIERTQKP